MRMGKKHYLDSGQDSPIAVHTVTIVDVSRIKVSHIAADGAGGGRKSVGAGIVKGGGCPNRRGGAGSAGAGGAGAAAGDGWAGDA